MVRSESQTDDSPDPDRPNLGDAPLTPDVLRLLQQRQDDKGEGNKEDKYSDRGEADALRPSVATSTIVVTQSSTTTTTASTQSTTTTLTSGCSGAIATSGPTPHMPHTEVMAVADADVSRYTIRLVGERHGTSLFNGELGIPTYMASSDVSADRPVSPDPRNTRFGYKDALSSESE
ncbi:hypothetical protein QAD02_012698 [Eretmocerus hayati]|uniref:Uncharacterized protein n=1 Tax=Eretmocerus hayati TaxID=131215 RepID=A0ACC2P0G1_9HYME|nr:hypothetical protein QAD02_012698 [Eretmocerus hayati]